MGSILRLILFAANFVRLEFFQHHSKTPLKVRLKFRQSVLQIQRESREFEKGWVLMLANCIVAEIKFPQSSLKSPTKFTREFKKRREGWVLSSEITLLQMTQTLPGPKHSRVS